MWVEWIGTEEPTELCLKRYVGGMNRDRRADTENFDWREGMSAAVDETHDLVTNHETHDLVTNHETHDLVTNHETHDLVTNPALYHSCFPTAMFPQYTVNDYNYYMYFWELTVFAMDLLSLGEWSPPGENWLPGLHCRARCDHHPGRECSRTDSLRLWLDFGHWTASRGDSQTAQYVILIGSVGLRQKVEREARTGVCTGLKP